MRRQISILFISVILSCIICYASEYIAKLATPTGHRLSRLSMRDTSGMQWYIITSKYLIKSVATMTYGGPSLNWSSAARSFREASLGGDLPPWIQVGPNYAGVADMWIINSVGFPFKQFTRYESFDSSSPNTPMSAQIHFERSIAFCVLNVAVNCMILYFSANFVRTIIRVTIYRRLMKTNCCRWCGYSQLNLPTNICPECGRQDTIPLTSK